MGNYRNFQLTVYFVAKGTATATREELEQDLSFFGKHMRLDRVYLEPFREELASHEQVELCRELFEKHGVHVAGGLTTVALTPEGAEEKQRLFNTLCYNDEQLLATLRKAVAFTASHFDEFIIDDFFFTNCTCAACRREKDRFNREHGITDGRWREYRLDLMRRVSERDILAVAKEANSNIRVTIKYPNWAESYQETGYAPALQRDLFDRVYTGTETRDPVTTDQHLPRYLSYSLMTYFENMCPGRNGGGWFDPFSTHITEHYLEQAYLTAFAKPKELMLFCFQALKKSMWVPALGFQLDRLDRTLDEVADPVGIMCYLPDDSHGEDNAQDFLGMVGLPVVCTPYFPEKAEAILLTRAAACDPQIVAKLDRYVADGGRALVTTGFLGAVEGKGIAALTSLEVTARRFTAERWRVEEDTPQGRTLLSFPDTQPVTLPVAEYRNNFSWGVVKAVRGEENIGFLFRDTYGKGELWTLAMPDAMPELYRLPSQVLSRLRQAFPVQGAWLEGGAGVSLFAYSNDSYIIYPYVTEKSQPQQVRLHVRGVEALELPLYGKELKPLFTAGGEAVFELSVTPGEWIVCRAAKESC